MELHIVKNSSLVHNFLGSFQPQYRAHFPLNSQRLHMFQSFFIKLKCIKIYIHFPCQVLSYVLMETLSYHTQYSILTKEPCI